MDLNFQKLNKPVDLIPAIIQDAQTNQVLMLGFMNKAAYQRTLKEGRVTFYSRSQGRLWTKGETSGNFLEVVEIQTDCDGDCLLVRVKPQGATCHRGEYSCFGEERLPPSSLEPGGDSLQFFLSLYSLIKQRQKTLPPDSYTARLFKQGLPKILAKIKEESGEIVQAAQAEGKNRTIEEISDLLYHLEVLMVSLGIKWGDVVKCLKTRQQGG